MNPIPEVLAPAGSPEALTAAVRCGAAAVYLGLDRFNARRAAHNFTTDNLKEAVDYCHARGVAVHLALNTLLREDELEEAVETAVTAATMGVDALILQDLGLTRRLRAIIPAMPLHASTQLSCHTPAGVMFLRDAGFSRVVLAREMNREEIAACTGLGVELEVFVHGALCMSVSGQCYFSAMLGSRSGNRGACAQPCRLPFEPTREQLRRCPADKAALSLKDNCLAAYVADLAAMGITSLKIEGRMKRPEYVAAATTVYAAAARGETPPAEALENLKKIFSRTGFTDGYYTDNRGGEMFGVRRKEDVTAAGDVLKTLQRTYDKEQPLIPVDMAFSLTTKEAVLSLWDGTHHVTVTGPGGEKAINRPLDPARAEEQLRKTGGTPFYVEQASLSLEEGLTLSMSTLNALRREGLKQLINQRIALPPMICEPTALPETVSSAAAPLTGRIVRLSSIKQYTPCLPGEMILLPLSTPTDAIKRLVAERCRVGVEIPRGLFGQEAAIRKALGSAAEAGATAALCGNVGALPLAKEAGLIPIGGFGLNITNRQALAFYASHGLAAATLSVELTAEQLRPLIAGPIATGLLVYGRLPLMLTRNCPRQAAIGSCSGCQSQGITDRTGTVFPVTCTGGCAEVLNSVPLYWGDRPEQLPATDFTLYHFTTETAQEVAALMEAYAKKAPPPAAITRGLYRRGVE